MKLTEYKKQAVRTMKAGMNYNDVMFGMIGEFGEAVECVKKKQFHNAKDIDEKLKKEIGDFLWYIVTFIEKKNELIRDKKLNKIDECIFNIQYHLTEIIFMNKESSVDNVMKNITELCSLYGFNLEEILQMNIDKLKIRYPEIYTDELSEKREDVYVTPQNVVDYIEKMDV